MYGTPSAPSSAVTRSNRILIDGFDAGIQTLLDTDHVREQIVSYERAAFAQKQAQSVWNRVATRIGSTLRARFGFLASEESRKTVYEPRTTDLSVHPIAHLENPLVLSQVAESWIMA